MRRNLTLEETGVLDLRKFIDTDEGMKLWFNSEKVIIPVNWLVSQGYVHIEASWNDETAVELWFTNKFPQCINVKMGNTNLEPDYLVRDHTTNTMYVSNYQAIKFNSISADGLVLECEEL